MKQSIISRVDGSQASHSRTKEVAVNTQTPAVAAVQQPYVRGFSAGNEQMPDAPDKLRLGRFSSGIEQLPDAPDKLRRGSFADGYADVR